MDSFGARATLQIDARAYEIFRLEALTWLGFPIQHLPYSLRILLENLLRHEDGVTVTTVDIRALAGWMPAAAPQVEIAFRPARVLLQDFTGVPALADLAAMRDAMAALGGDPARINPLIPVELVIDHSIQVDDFGRAESLAHNEALDYERNAERYRFIKWGAQAFRNFRSTPPNVGICHQVNLEHLARVVFDERDGVIGASGLPQAFPDTVIGTDSHTPMVNGAGVLGWGVGGIEAEAAMLGQPVSMLIPQVIGFRLTGRLPEGCTATDVVLTVTERLRRHGVVGSFVEFFGPGIAELSVADRSTISNMSPEFGSTCTYFPVDRVTLDYLRLTGRDDARLALVETYMKTQGLFFEPDAPEPLYTSIVELDLADVQPSVAGPRRPQDRVPLSGVREAFHEALPSLLPPKREPESQKGGVSAERVHGHRLGAWGEGNADSPALGEAPPGDAIRQLRHGSVVIAAITSCTNTSNPAVMLAAGLLAKKAVEKGLQRKPWVKTSLAPGSKVVTAYYQRAGLMPYLEELGFYLAGYGCTTCIGNSGPLPAEISQAIDDQGLVVASVLSGNRNFEGRINSDVRANFLMSPPLVVAFALTGRIDIDLATEPLGTGRDGQAVYLRDIWPASTEIERVMHEAISADLFTHIYERLPQGDARWDALPVAPGERYPWDEASTYLRRPPFFDRLTRHAPDQVREISNARALLVLGDSVTTDHISPAGTIKRDSPAGHHLHAHGVAADAFNSYGARRGNHEVMVRGTFANTRLRNRLVSGVEGPLTLYLPAGEVMTVYDAARQYREENVPLIVLAGREYGSGSSRDWAAKGPQLLGVRAVIAESFERIHRSNLVGMGILPLQFLPGESLATLGLTGTETFTVRGLADAVFNGFGHGRDLTVEARAATGAVTAFQVQVRIDTPQELSYYRHGGILPYMLRQLLAGRAQPAAISRSLAAGPHPEPGHIPRRDAIEQGSIESFPASDPPAY